MGITSTLSTALSGLASNQAKLDVIGNNIANVNTVAFKSSRLDFKTQFSQSFSFGSAPNSDLGGTNPLQVGLGVVPGAISRDFADGSREVTGVDTNLAIEGDGFFIVKDSSQQAYTRDGSFKLNSDHELVNSSGLRVQGFGVDANFTVVPGALQGLTIPIGSMTVAEATTAQLTGGLKGNGDLPTTVSDLTMNQQLFVSDGAGGVTGTAPTAATLLSDIADSSGGLTFSPGQTLSFTGEVGGKAATAQTLNVTATTTLGDLMNFMSGTLGINTTTGANGAIATTPGSSLLTGGTISAGAALLSIAGNVGTANDLALDANSLTIVGSATPTSFSWNTVSKADGESVATTIPVFDSLGTQLNVNVTASIISKTSTGTTWQFYATSPDGTATGAATQTAAGTGTITFDNNGNYVSSTTPTVTLDRSNTGATPTLAFSLDFSGLSDLASANSKMTGSANGISPGSLQDFSIDQSGLIKGTFSNGVSRTLGQVAMATFRNNQGLVDKGGNLFQEGANSGTAVISAPGDFSAGHIIAGELELSNVDLSSEFVNLISASTGFSASSRVITTSNQLLQELLSASR